MQAPAISAPSPVSSDGGCDDAALRNLEFLPEDCDLIRLFRERCDDQKRLSFEAMLEISEISGWISEGAITRDELNTMWAGLPSN
eukprot:13368533-Alexandrium_andersonii.AAC.1